MPVFVIAEAAGRGPSVIPCFVRVVDATEKFGIQGFRGIRFHGKIQWPPSIFTELLCPELLACLSPYLAPLLAKPLLHNTQTAIGTNAEVAQYRTTAAPVVRG